MDNKKQQKQEVAEFNKIVCIGCVLLLHCHADMILCVATSTGNSSTSGVSIMQKWEMFMGAFVSTVAGGNKPQAATKIKAKSANPVSALLRKLQSRHEKSATAA